MAEKTEGSSFMDPFKGLLLTYFMPESCYDEFFLNFNFLDGENVILVQTGSREHVLFGVERCAEN